MINNVNRLVTHHRTFLLYCIIGASGALIDLILFLVLYKAFGVDPFIANFFSVSAGIINNFFLNRSFNFKKHDHLWKRLGLFYVIGLLGLALSELLLFVLHERAGLDAGLSKAASIPLVVIAQFLLNKTLSFSDDPRKVFAKHNVIVSLFLSVFLCLALLNSIYFFFGDEHDNIRGAQLITRGMLPYVDFFSHHMPLTYFLGVPFYIFAGTNIILFKFSFAALLFAWLIIIARHVRAQFGQTSAAIFVATMVVSQPLLWSHMLLAETIIAYAACHAFMLLFYRIRTSRKNKISDIFLVGLLASTIVLNSAAYIWLSLLIYALLALYLLRNILRLRDILNITKQIVLHASLLGLPYVIFALYLATTGSLEAFIEQAYKFNIEYYSQFVDETHGGMLSSLLHQLKIVATSVWQVISHPQLGEHILLTVGLIGAIASITVLALNKQYLLASAMTLFVVVSSVRGGFLVNFQNHGGVRHATTLACLTILFASMALGVINRTRERALLAQLGKSALLLAFFIPVLVAGSAHSLTNYEAYISNNNTINLPTDGIEQPVRVINAVNKDRDTYWTGPMDFYSQLFIESEVASKYGFFLPWHAVCESCVGEFIAELKQNKPRVIYFYKDLEILGHKAENYSQPLMELLQKDYYRVENPMLQYFYFLSEDKTEIDQALRIEGIIK